jgi:hypothetical protein
MLSQKDKVFTMLDRRVDIGPKSLALLSMEIRLNLLKDSDAYVNASPTRESGPVVGAIRINVEMGGGIRMIRPAKFSDRVRPALDDTLDAYIFIKFVSSDTTTPGALKMPQNL